MTETNTLAEHFQRAIPETGDLWDIWSEWLGHMTGPKKKKTNTKTMTKTITAKEHLQRVILVTCDIWDTGYISDDWEPEFMTIFVTWQLRVTRDSIRNSCDVLETYMFGDGRKWKTMSHYDSWVAWVVLNCVSAFSFSFIGFIEMIQSDCHDDVVLCWVRRQTNSIAFQTSNVLW